MIVYLHGFRSSPHSRKARALRERMRARNLEDQYRCPALPASPRLASHVALDAALTSPVDGLALVGSSLGGYYATWVAERLGCRAVLLNPAVDPASDLAQHIGRQRVFFSEEEIDFRPEYIQELRDLQVPVTQPERYFLLAATGDTVIDYRKMVDKYRGARHRIVEGGDHELSDFSEYLDEVMLFCGIQ